MRTNIFLRSTLRQPVKAAFLVIVMALVTFAFAARGAEYLLIRQEAARLGTYYRAVGTLEQTRGDHWADTGEAAAYLQSREDMAVVDQIEYTSGTIQDGFSNGDIDPETRTFRIAFCGTLQSVDYGSFSFVVDEPLLGYEDYLAPGQVVTLNMGVNSSFDPEQAEALVTGERYLAFGMYAPGSPGCALTADPDTGRLGEVSFRLLSFSEDAYFYPMPAGVPDWSDPALAEWKEWFDFQWEEQRALHVAAVEDVSTLPLTADKDKGLYLTAGRWPDGADTAAGNRVCAVNGQFASLRGLKVGDALTLELRDIPSLLGYCNSFSELNNYEVRAQARRQTETFEIVGIYDSLSTFHGTADRNFVYVPATAVPADFAMSRRDLERDVNDQGLEYGDYYDYLLQELGGTGILPHPGTVSFVLAEPGAETAFLEETRVELEKLGFRAEMEENNWENFQAAAGPMERSALVSAALFTAVLAVGLALTAFLYFRPRRRDMGSARALGLPAGRCARQAAGPLLLIGALGTGLGAVLGWRQLERTAGETLRVLTGLSGGAAEGLPVWNLAAIWGAAFALLAVIAAGAAWFLATRPVLRLIQGAAQPPAKNRTASAAAGRDDPGAPSAEKMTAFDGTAHRAAVPHTRKRCSLGVAMTVRFVWRHIVRSRLKTALTIALAAGFTIGLGAIRLSIVDNGEKIDRLYENTPVEAELLQADTGVTFPGGGFLRGSTVDALLESGYVTDAYLEGAASGAAVRYTEDMEKSGGISAGGDDVSDCTIRAFADEGTFLSAAGSGECAAITYLDGWDASLFAQDWSGSFPVVLPKALYDQLEAGELGKIGLSCRGFRVCEAAGYYEGSVDGADAYPILAPLSAYRQLSDSRAPTYCKAHVTLDPALNRELERFTEIVNDAAASQGTLLTALRAVIWDGELRQAVEPLERALSLMELLYPVVLVLSLLTATGTAVLFVMMSAKDAAILRIQGTSKLHTTVIFVLQQGITVLAGLAVGLAGSLLWTGVRPELAGASLVRAALYLAAAVAGTILSAASVTGKNPLEMLQVKE